GGGGEGVSVVRTEQDLPNGDRSNRDEEPCQPTPEPADLRVVVEVPPADKEKRDIPEVRLQADDDGNEITATGIDHPEYVHRYEKRHQTGQRLVPVGPV